MCMYLIVMVLVHWHKLMVGDGVVRFTTTGDTAGVIDGSEGDCGMSTLFHTTKLRGNCLLNAIGVK